MSTLFWFLFFSLPSFALVGLGVHPLLVAAIVAAVTLALVFDQPYGIRIQIIFIEPRRGLSYA